ncbi:unnamed protein product [Closterium sp. Yama58-4]|nr:unnamed protein product [Closterium sp. Yama58-4]
MVPFLSLSARKGLREAVSEKRSAGGDGDGGGVANTGADSAAEEDPGSLISYLLRCLLLTPLPPFLHLRRSNEDKATRVGTEAETQETATGSSMSASSPVVPENTGSGSVANQEPFLSFQMAAPAPASTRPDRPVQVHVAAGDSLLAVSPDLIGAFLTLGELLAQVSAVISSKGSSIDGSSSEGSSSGGSNSAGSSSIGTSKAKDRSKGRYRSSRGSSAGFVKGTDPTCVKHPPTSADVPTGPSGSERRPRQSGSERHPQHPTCESHCSSSLDSLFAALRSALDGLIPGASWRVNATSGRLWLAVGVQADVAAAAAAAAFTAGFPCSSESASNGASLLSLSHGKVKSGVRGGVDTAATFPGRVVVEGGAAEAVREGGGAAIAVEQEEQHHATVTSGADVIVAGVASLAIRLRPKPPYNPCMGPIINPSSSTGSPIFPTGNSTVAGNATVNINKATVGNAGQEERGNQVPGREEAKEEKGQKGNRGRGEGDKVGIEETGRDESRGAVWDRLEQAVWNGRPRSARRGRECNPTVGDGGKQGGDGPVGYGAVDVHQVWHNSDVTITGLSIQAVGVGAERDEVAIDEINGVHSHEIRWKHRGRQGRISGECDAVKRSESVWTVVLAPTHLSVLASLYRCQTTSLLTSDTITSAAALICVPAFAATVPATVIHALPEVSLCI